MRNSWFAAPPISSMPPHTWLPFFVAAWLICLSPGSGVLSSVTAAMRFGARALRLLGSAQAQRWTNRGFGGLFVGAGVLLAAFKRSA